MNKLYPKQKIINLKELKPKQATIKRIINYSRSIDSLKLKKFKPIFVSKN